MRLILVVALALSITLSVGQNAGAAGPHALDTTLALTTDELGRIQISAFLSGPVNETVGYKIGGWFVDGNGDSNSFLADAYLDYTQERVYVAAGQKFVPFGPAGGLLVSPGIRGGHVKFKLPNTTLQVVTGETEFTPATGGGPRWTPSPLYPPGTIRPNEDMTGARLDFDLSPSSPGAIRLGVNGLWTLSETGYSGDLEIGLPHDVRLIGESAHFDGVHAWVVGLAFWNLGPVFDTTRPTSGVLLYRDVPMDYAPSIVGTTAYFPAQDGIAGGVYHELRPGRVALGVFADSRDASITLFNHIPLD